MPPERKFNSFVLSGTLAIMAAALTYVPALSEEKVSKPVEIVVSVLTGTGLYEALSRLIEFLLSRSKKLKRIILGKSYVEGKWAGYWIGHGGRPRYVIENVKQDWSSVLMTGMAFDENLAPHGHWQSVGAAVDGERGNLHAVFAGDIGGQHYDSIITFRLAGKPPSRMSGFVADAVGAVNAGQVWLFEQRVGESLSESETLKVAQQMYASRPATAALGANPSQPQGAPAGQAPAAGQSPTAGAAVP
jgi:hypothetical protein